MHCSEVTRRTSEYLDRRLGDAERSSFAEHLVVCARCRARVEETRAAVRLLRESAHPAPPPDLFDATMRAIDRTAAPRLTIMTLPPRRRLRPQGGILRFLNRLAADYEFNIIAYSVGLVVTFFLFGGTILGLRPLWEVARDMRADDPTIWITGSEARVMGVPAESGYTTVAYTLPRVDRTGSLPQFAANTGGGADSDDILVLAEVMPDGRASIVEVLNGPNDPDIVNSLQVALDRPAFVPASAVSESGQPVASRVVLLLQRVDVVG